MEELHPTIAQATDLTDWSICGSDMVYSPFDAARQIFGESDRDYRASQFIYLFRRFGYPIHGWDDYKSLVSYFLTTPDPQIVLWCNPNRAFWTSFGYGLHPDLARESERIYFRWVRAKTRTTEWKDHAIHQRIDHAIRTTMRELLRPVPVRSMVYNIKGLVADDCIQWEYAEYSPQAGYGLGEHDVVKPSLSD